MAVAGPLEVNSPLHRVTGWRSMGWPMLLARGTARSWVQGHPPGLLEDADLVRTWQGGPARGLAWETPSRGYKIPAQHGFCTTGSGVCRLCCSVEQWTDCPQLPQRQWIFSKSSILPSEQTARLPGFIQRPQKLHKESSLPSSDFWVQPEVTALFLPWTLSPPPSLAPWRLHLSPHAPISPSGQPARPCGRRAHRVLCSRPVCRSLSALPTRQDLSNDILRVQT